jgi:hypothetical protein
MEAQAKAAKDNIINPSGDTVFDQWKEEVKSLCFRNPNARDVDSAMQTLGDLMNHAADTMLQCIQVCAGVLEHAWISRLSTYLRHA